MTSEELKDFILLYRNLIWREQLDIYEGEALRIIQFAIANAERTIIGAIQEIGAGASEWSVASSIALLDELKYLTVGIQGILVSDIAAIASQAGAASYLTHNAIVSFDGMISPFNPVILSAAQLRNIIREVPVKGYSLQEWIARTFDSTMISGIKTEIATGQFLGESYSELLSRIAAGFGIVQRNTKSLASTYIQEVNVGAMEDIYKANMKIVKGVKWVSVMEVGKGKGRGTCLRCAALDGQQFIWGEKRPPCPQHFNCRCSLVPQMLTWRELGVNSDEVDRLYRPWVNNIDTGFRQGNFATWFSQMPEADQLAIVGSGRLGLLQSGAISFQDLADRATGKLRLLDKNLSGRIVGLR